MWMGEFAVNLGVQFQIGHSRGERSQLGALNIDEAEFFSTLGDSVNDMILRQRHRLEQNSVRSAELDPLQIHAGLSVSRSDLDPKSRWVDGTPEYSLYICGLRKLFPDAKFVHLVRDVSDVVSSLMNFRPDEHSNLVETEQQAYEYWLRTVRACVLAEQALGAQAIHRLRYDDLVQRPEWALRGVLEFLGEPFTAACTEPLTHRINSSNVPDNFRSADPRTDSKMVDQALLLSAQLQQPLADYSPSHFAMHEFAADFRKRVANVAGRDTQYTYETGRLAEIISKLLTKLNWSGALLAIQLLLAIGVTLIVTSLMPASSHPGVLFLLITSMICIGVYLVIRPNNPRHLVARLMRRKVPK